MSSSSYIVLFVNDTATTEIYTYLHTRSLHDALPILPFGPKLNGNANVDYSWNLGTETKAFVGASLRSLSKQRANFDAGFGALYGLGRRTIPAYEVIDLRAEIGRAHV